MFPVFMMILAPWVWRIPEEGGTALDLGATNDYLEQLSVRPHGSRITFSTETLNPEPSQLWVMENFLPPLKNAKWPSSGHSLTAADTRGQEKPLPCRERKRDIRANHVFGRLDDQFVYFIWTLQLLFQDVFLGFQGRDLLIKTRGLFAGTFFCQRS
jgi:hypothetical protein